MAQDFTGSASVAYRLHDGSAEYDEDYLTDGGVLIFADGQNSQVIALDIIDDLRKEQAETLTIELYNPVSATLGEVVTLTVTIEDDDKKGGTMPGVALFALLMLWFWRRSYRFGR